MKYTIGEDRLYKVFCRFLNENMGKLYYDEPDNEFYHFGIEIGIIGVVIIIWGITDYYIRFFKK